MFALALFALLMRGVAARSGWQLHLLQELVVVGAVLDVACLDEAARAHMCLMNQPPLYIKMPTLCVVEVDS